MTFDLFISYNRKDAEAVERLSSSLEQRGMRCLKDDWYLTPGRHWPTELEKKLEDCRGIVVAIGSNGIGPWQRREICLAISRQETALAKGLPEPLVIPLFLDASGKENVGLGLIDQNLWVEYTDPRALDIITGALNGVPPHDILGSDCKVPRYSINPYRGLRYFREEDRDFYFGREVETQRLIEAVDKSRIVAVIGASGSGKSSIVNSGLIPALRSRIRPSAWQFISVKSLGESPFRSLAEALLPIWEKSKYDSWDFEERWERTVRLGDSFLEYGIDRLQRVFQEILDTEPGTGSILLFLDQFEELYVYRSSENASFFKMILEVSRLRYVRIVIALRADFWGHILTENAEIAHRLVGEGQTATLHLPALNRDAIRMTITKPAERADLSVEDGLIEALLNDALGEPGELPLLQFALDRLWHNRTTSNSTLTLHSYRKMGKNRENISGLVEAMIDHANDAYSSLNLKERRALPGLFAAIVHVEENRTDLRRRAWLAELSSAGKRVARILTNERLLVMDQDPETEEATVEVAHEALLRYWPRLRDWVSESRDALQSIRRLERDSVIWLENDKASTYLWPHELVKEAASAIERIGEHWLPNETMKEFLGPIKVPEMLEKVDDQATPPELRWLIGDRLAVFGDPRPGVGLTPDGLPDFDWVDVPSGTVVFPVLQEHDNLNSGIKGHVTSEVDAFQISRYPVTFLQFHSFQRACRTNSGWNIPNLQFDLSELTRPPRPVTRFANHPIDTVSWFHALAFCHWLSEELQCQIRLPTEFEWQQAASNGEDWRVYPWQLNPDQNWDATNENWFANTEECDLLRATAVGMYPLGATPNRIFDMSGSMWEWCQNKFDAPHDSDFSADAHRTLRGGSWNDPQVAATITNRMKAAPHNRYLTRGFRVVRSR